MGKSPKNFWTATSTLSEAKIKMILKYVSSKKTKPPNDPPIRMSDLNDSFTSFKNGGTHNSTFTESEDTSFVSKSEEDTSLKEAANQHILVSTQQVRISKPKKILVKISVEELDSSEENVDKPTPLEKSCAQHNFNESDTFSKDSLDFSGIQKIDDSTDFNSSLKNKCEFFCCQQFDRNNKSFFEEYEDYKHNLNTPQKKPSTIQECKNCEKAGKNNRSFLDEFEEYKKKVLLPTDTNYYTPRTKARTDDEKIADVIRELVLKKFEQRRKPKKHHIIKAGSSTLENVQNLTDDLKTNEIKPAVEESRYYSCNLDSVASENIFEKIVRERFSVRNKDDTADGRGVIFDLQAKMKQQALDFLALKSQAESQINSPQAEKRKPTRSPLNQTFVKEESTLGSDNGQSEKVQKSTRSTTSYYTQEELESTSTCSSEGVYDCLSKAVLPKEEVSPYFRKIGNLANKEASEKSISYEEIQYDRREFLKQALGSEHEFSYSDSSISFKQPKRSEPIYDRSIDTDNISTLISSGSVAPQKFNNKKLKRDLNSVNTFSSVLTEANYSDLVYESKYVVSKNDAGTSSQHDSGMSSGAGVKKPPRKSLPNVAKNNREIFNAPPVIQRKSYPLYEDVILTDSSTDDVDTTKSALDDLLQRIVQQSELIKQAEGLLERGSSRKHFYGSIPHLEAERIRLVSILRKDVLERQLIDETYKNQSKEDSVLAKLIIKNASCTSSVPSNGKSSTKHYFIGVFQNDTTVMSTNYAQPNMFGDIEFDGQFTFEDLKSDFEIKFSLYSLSVENKRQVVGCFPRKFNKGKKRKYLELVGTHKFQKNTANTKTAIKLENYKDYTASYKYAAQADLFIKTVEPLKGVLSVGTENKGHPVWNSRWCVLEGTSLKMFMFPSDEFYGKPLASLDLKKCQSCELDRSVGELFKSPALKLVFDVNNARVTRYLIADDSKQLDSWQKHILTTIETNKCW